MPRGQKDYGALAVTETIAGLSDMGELAARLGSVVTFDRRGDVVWFDDFQGDLNKWRDEGLGTDHDAYITAEEAYRGSFSCRLITGSDGPLRASITHNERGLVFSKIGIEVAFTLHTDLSEFRITLIYHGGGNFYNGEIMYLPDPVRELRYLDVEEDDITFATGLLVLGLPKQYNVLKFVLDLPNAKYDRVLLNHLSYDLSDIPLRTAGTAAASQLEVYIETTATAGNVESSLGYVIITQNEP